MLKYYLDKETPRALIELGFHLLDELFVVVERYTDDLISKDTWERGLAKVGKSSFGEEVTV